MKLTELTVRNPQATVVMIGLLVALGLGAVLGTPRAQDPTFPMATFSIETIFPGATPSDIEQLVVDPLERSLARIDDIKRLRSRAEAGVSATVVEFEAGVDVEAKHDAVIRQVEATRS
jgi:multidrug efflux pump subunit AcrB